jgi:hypothetical protein
MSPAANWHDFATVIGGASGALTGLLFVAASLNAARIARHAGLRASAAQTLVLFITPLLIAAALLVPRQPDWVLGAELVVTGLVAGVVMLSNRQVKRGLTAEDLRLVNIFNRTTPAVIAVVLIVAGGAVLAAGQGAGLYLLYPASIVAFVSGMINAWFFLLPPPDTRLPRQAGDGSAHLDVQGGDEDGEVTSAGARLPDRPGTADEGVSGQGAPGHAVG